MWAAVCMCVQCMMYLCLALCVCGALFFVSLYLSLSVYSTDILQSLIGIVLNRKWKSMTHGEVVSVPLLLLPLVMTTMFARDFVFIYTSHFCCTGEDNGGALAESIHVLRHYSLLKIPWRSIFELTEPPLFNYGLYFVIVANCILLGLMIITSSCWRLSSMIVQRVQRVLCVHRYAFARTSYVQKYITRVYLCSYAKVSFCVRVESLNRAWTLFVCLAIRRLQNTLEYCYNSSWVLHFWTITVTVSIKG